MSIKLTEIIGENRALFENDANGAQDQGDITFSHTSLGNDEYIVDFQGTDVEGGTIGTTNTEGTIYDINPTKVFWLIANTMKEVLCPECV